MDEIERSHMTSTPGATNAPPLDWEMPPSKSTPDTESPDTLGELPNLPSPTPAPERWTDEELENPHETTGKDRKVRGMFAAIADKYDLNNRLHSFWQDQRWRKHAVRKASVSASDHVLDVACGTGDLTEAFAKAGVASVTGLDFTREMLDIARVKRRRLPELRRARVTYEQGDAHALPYDDGAFNVVSIAFGIRNVQDPSIALREFERVLRPGGRLVILEFADPPFAPIRWGSDLYTKRIMPLTATLISGDKTGAYKYLPQSVSTFMEPSVLTNAIAEAGFQQVRVDHLSLGVCNCYVALKCPPAAS